jgi:hypothetical protein
MAKPMGTFLLCPRLTQTSIGVFAVKILIAASVLAGALSVGLPSVAQAETNFKLYLGLPHYGYRVGPDYRFREGYGWYRPSVGVRHGRLSCNEAKRMVRRSGFRNVSTIECSGRTYTFEATRRGRDITVYVNSRTGAVWRG